jgi:hypothetical protein
VPDPREIKRAATDYLRRIGQYITQNVELELGAWREFTQPARCPSPLEQAKLRASLIELMNRKGSGVKLSELLL